jgi:hypothetical protein
LPPLAAELIEVGLEERGRLVEWEWPVAGCPKLQPQPPKALWATSGGCASW